MKYIITKTSGYPDDIVDWGKDPICSKIHREIVTLNDNLEEANVVSLESLEELHQLSDEVGHSIILHVNSIEGYELPELEIYDDYRE